MVVVETGVLVLVGTGVEIHFVGIEELVVVETVFVAATSLRTG